MKNKLRITNYELRIAKILCLLCLLCVSILSIKAQSTDQNFPTPVTSNEINGKVAARDIGDSRLTSYFYIFNGNQGDVFINVVTKNLDGDIDVFTFNGLKPLTKIRVYSDNSDNETGRIVYLRQPEKLILRIEGRTPNDEPATFRIKFAGSFEPVKAIAGADEQNQPEVKAENQGEVRVNSVGTIIETKPKPTPKPLETKEEKTETIAEEKDAPVVVVTDKLPKADETVKKEEKTEDKTAEKNTAKTKKKTTKTEKTVEPNPLENINLIVLLKDGTKIERPMSEVVRVNVDKGVLTIILKDGTISRHSILDVAEMTIK
jgi:hypothetical protein